MGFLLHSRSENKGNNMPSYKVVTDGTKLVGEAMPRLVREFQADVVGKTITGAGYLDMDGEAWPILLLRDPKTGAQSHILVQSDDEGNGPGVLVTDADHCLCQTSVR